MKLSIGEKIGFGAGDMAIAIVMMSMAIDLPPELDTTVS